MGGFEPPPDGYRKCSGGRQSNTASINFNRSGGIANWRHPLTSAKTVGKEITKHVLGRLGDAKYRLQAPNRVMGERQLRDGQILPEFIRCNPHFGGVSCCEKGRDIHHVLTPRLLDVLVKRQGICILYTHLGKLNNSRMFDPPAIEALRYLAEQMRLQRVLVTTTARLLDYLFWRDRLRFRYVRRDRQAEIVVEPTSELTNTTDSVGYQGLSFEVPGDDECRLVQASGERLETQTTFKSGHRQILSIPWDRLRFPDWG